MTSGPGTGEEVNDNSFWLVADKESQHILYRVYGLGV